MYFDTVGIVASSSGTSTATFKANIGLKQGDVAAPLLFSLLFDRVVQFMQ